MELPLFTLPNYQPIFSKIRSKRGGGVAIYVKDGIRCNLTNECSFLTVSAIFSDKTFHFTCVYNPPDENKIQFIDTISEFIRDKNLPNHIIGGDFNIDLLKMDSISDYFSNELSMIDYKLASPLLPTRKTSTTASCIDHIFTNCSYKTSKIIEISVSDHFALDVVVDSAASKKPLTTQIRSLHLVKHDNFRFCLEQTIKIALSHTCLETTKDANEAFAVFEHVIEKILGLFTPIREVFPQKNMNSWISNKLKSTFLKRDIARRN